MVQRVEDILEQSGVKGMRWGYRKAGTGSASPNKKGSSDDSHQSDDAKKASSYATRAKTSGTKNLSNQELQHLVNRMDLEQRYSRVATGSAGKSKIRKGADFVGNMASNITKQQVQIAAGAIVAKQLSNVLRAKGLV